MRIQKYSHDNSEFLAILEIQALKLWLERFSKLLVAKRPLMRRSFEKVLTITRIFQTVFQIQVLKLWLCIFYTFLLQIFEGLEIFKHFLLQKAVPKTFFRKCLHDHHECLTIFEIQTLKLRFFYKMFSPLKD